MSTARPYTFDRVVRILGSLALLACAVWLINTLKNVLLPFCLACLIAYLLEPLVGLNKKYLRLPGRILAIFMTLLEVTVVIGLLLYFFIPSVLREFHEMDQLIRKYQESGISAPLIPAEVTDWISAVISHINVKELLDGGHLETIVNQGTSLVSTVIDFLFHTVEWLLAFIYVIFILLDYEKLMRGFQMLVPPRYRAISQRISTDIKNSMNRYFRSQALIAMCAAVFYCIGFSIVGLPMAIIMGITVGLLYMIPYFQYVTLIPVVILCFVSSLGGDTGFWTMLGQCIVVYVVSQCICDYVLTPKIMGKAMGLNPAIILLSLSVWGTLLGLIGMIIALPLTTLLLAYYQEYVIDASTDDPAVKSSEKKTLHSITDK